MSLTPTRARATLIADVVEVRSVERLSPSFVRLELGGDALADFGVEGPLLDQRVKLVLPGPSGRPPELTRSADWYAAWLALPPDERGHLRTYTVRAVRGRGTDTRLVVDVVVHPDDNTSGPGAAWAAQARPGSRVGLVAPRRGHRFGGIEFAPGGAGRLLLVGDETAVPAVASILEDLPADAAGTAYLEVPGPGDVLDLAPPRGVRVVWLPRRGEPHGERACRAVLALFGLPGGSGPEVAVDPDLWETPTYSSSGEPVARGSGAAAGDLYAWVAGESRMVARIRRHLVGDVGLDRRQVAFMGYWRAGVAMRS